MMAVDVESSSQLNSEFEVTAGNYHMANEMLIIVVRLCGNATSQTNAIVNVKSDGFENNSPMNELTLPNFNDSSNQIVLNILRDLDKYYSFINFPEPVNVGGKFTKA